MVGDDRVKKLKVIQLVAGVDTGMVAWILSCVPLWPSVSVFFSCWVASPFVLADLSVVGMQSASMTGNLSWFDESEDPLDVKILLVWVPFSRGFCVYSLMIFGAPFILLVTILTVDPFGSVTLCPMKGRLPFWEPLGKGFLNGFIVWWHRCNKSPIKLLHLF